MPFQHMEDGARFMVLLMGPICLYQTSATLTIIVALLWDRIIRFLLKLRSIPMRLLACLLVPKSLGLFNTKCMNCSLSDSFVFNFIFFYMEITILFTNGIWKKIRPIFLCNFFTFGCKIGKSSAFCSLLSTPFLNYNFCTAYSFVLRLAFLPNL
jgi:hypothetical protein